MMCDTTEHTLIIFCLQPVLSLHSLITQHLNQSLLCCWVPPVALFPVPAGGLFWANLIPEVLLFPAALQRPDEITVSPLPWFLGWFWWPFGLQRGKWTIYTLQHCQLAVPAQRNLGAVQSWGFSWTGCDCWRKVSYLCLRWILNVMPVYKISQVHWVLSGRLFKAN